MIDETIIIETCGLALDQIADKDYDGAIETISKLRAKIVLIPLYKTIPV